MLAGVHSLRINRSRRVSEAGSLGMPTLQSYVHLIAITGGESLMQCGMAGNVVRVDYDG